MSGEQDRILAAMRSMAWERAKGELTSMLHTYYDDQERFNDISERIDRFVQSIEDNGLAE